jgi:hypothetical protein
MHATGWHTGFRHTHRSRTYKALYHLRAVFDLIIIHCLHGRAQTLLSLADLSDMYSKTNVTAPKRACDG